MFTGGDVILEGTKNYFGSQRLESVLEGPLSLEAHHHNDWRVWTDGATQASNMPSMVGYQY